MAFVKELPGADNVVPILDRCYTLRQIVEALRYVEAGHEQEKVVINVVASGTNKIDRRKSMSVQSMRLGTVAPDGRWLYRVSSFSAILFGIAYIIIIALFVPLGAKPKGAEPWLAYIAAHQTAWWAILYLSVLTDFLLVPIALSLYLILQANNRNMMLIACAAVGLFVFLDLALTQINYAAIITLSSSYTAATNDAQRAVFVTAALYSSTVVDSNLLFIYNTFTLSVGILLTGFAMRNGIFGKSTAYIGLTTGLLGVIAVTGAFVVNTVLVTVVASTLTLIWFFFVGFDLYRLSR